MQQERVGLGSGFPRELTAGFADGLLLPLIHFLLLGFLPIAAMRRSGSPALGAGCGQMIAVRKDAYQLAGGHGAVRRTMHDGIMLPRAFRAAGVMTGIFDASRFATCRMYGNTGDLLEGLLKNATEGMAKPIALPIWTLILGFGQVLPLLLMLLQPGLVLFVALLVGIATRLLLALRFHAPVWSAFSSAGCCRSACRAVGRVVSPDDAAVPPLGAAEPTHHETWFAQARHSSAYGGIRSLRRS